MPEDTPKPATERIKSSDFTARYANNVYLESSAWDLKLVLGQLDQSSGETIVQHTAVTMPWPQVKMLAYLLQVHIAMHENRLARVAVPGGLIFKVIGDMPEDFSQQFTNNPEGLWQKLRSLYDAFIAENPEAA